MFFFFKQISWERWPWISVLSIFEKKKSINRFYQKFRFKKKSTIWQIKRMKSIFDWFSDWFLFNFSTNFRSIFRWIFLISKAIFWSIFIRFVDWFLFNYVTSFCLNFIPIFGYFFRFLFSFFVEINQLILILKKTIFNRFFKIYLNPLIN